MSKTARYEVLMLSTPEITQDEAKDLEKQLERVIQTTGGSILSFERWGKYRLCYPVRKNEYGVYFLFRFHIPKDEKTLQEIKTLLSIKFETIVMRSLITTLPDTASLEYQRPRSLEEGPAMAEGSFRDRRARMYESSDSDESMGGTELSDEEFVSNGTVAE